MPNKHWGDRHNPINVTIFVFHSLINNVEHRELSRQIVMVAPIMLVALEKTNKYATAMLVNNAHVHMPNKH